MSTSNFNTISMVLIASGILAIAGSVVCLVAAVLRWRSPTRSTWLIRAACCVGTYVLLAVAHLGIMTQIYLPSVGREARQQAQEQEDARESQKIGKASPGFSILVDDGKTFDLAKHHGKVVVVNFFATWCGPCLTELPQLQQVWDSHKSRDDFTLLVIGRGETVETLAKFKQEHGYTFPMAADPDRGVYREFADRDIPRTYLIGRDGTIAFSSVGYTEEKFAAFEKVLTRTLNTTSR